jgi:hypothetical protein
MRVILMLKERADKEILNKLSSKVKIIFVSLLINVVGIETEAINEISEIKKLDFVKSASAKLDNLSWKCEKSINDWFN